MGPHLFVPVAQVRELPYPLRLQNKRAQRFVMPPLSNKKVGKLLTMPEYIAVFEDAYVEWAEGREFPTD